MIKGSVTVCNSEKTYEVLFSGKLITEYKNDDWNSQTDSLAGTTVCIVKTRLELVANL